MKKEKKLYRVFISMVEIYEDHEDVHYCWKPFYRKGVSEKQVIARLRRQLGLYNYDSMDGQCAVEYRFDVTDAKPHGYTTLTVFDFDWSED